jgi:hypothetical protein
MTCVRPPDPRESAARFPEPRREAPPAAAYRLAAARPPLRHAVELEPAGADVRVLRPAFERAYRLEMGRARRSAPPRGSTWTPMMAAATAGAVGVCLHAQPSPSVLFLALAGVALSWFAHLR